MVYKKILLLIYMILLRYILIFCGILPFIKIGIEDYHGIKHIFRYTFYINPYNEYQHILCLFGYNLSKPLNFHDNFWTIYF